MSDLLEQILSPRSTDHYSRVYTGNVDDMPMFVGCSDVDPHIPLARVRETAEVFTELGGDVTMQIYPAMGHTINQDEIDSALTLVLGVVGNKT